jgi:hypothetical protein
MITNKGQNIVASYLAGNASTYATHIALGCGPNPIMNGTYDTYYNKDSLEFEMFRVPIVSKSVLTNSLGISTITLGAELPTQNTYNISEIGIFSGSQNPDAGEYDSKNIFSFIATEPWEYHSDFTTTQIVTALKPPITDSLDNLTSPTNTIRDIESLDPTNFIPVFQTTINNSIFTSNADRLTRYENCRFFNTAIVMPGNISNITRNNTTQELEVTPVLVGLSYNISKIKVNSNKVTITTTTSNPILQGQHISISGASSTFDFLNGKEFQVTSATETTITFPYTNANISETSSTGSISVTTYSSHIHIKNNLGVGTFDKNDANNNDELKLAFSIVNKVGKNTSFPQNANPSAVRIIIEFATSENEKNRDYAQFVVDLDSGTTDFINNRYFVVTKKFSELIKTKTFAWNNVTAVKVFATVLEGTKPSSNFYVFLDGMRLENKTTINPLYGLTGYSVINFSNKALAQKLPNTKNYVEFRFDLNFKDPGV